MLEKMLRHDEGCKTTVYWDHLGYPTIGIGHLIIKEATKDMAKINRILSEHVGRQITDGKITDVEVSNLLRKDINSLRVTLEKYADLRDAYYRVDPIRQFAIENMCFQQGVAGVAKFKKMIAALSAGKWDEAQKQGLDSLWAKQTPNRAKRVTEVLRTGDMSPYGL